MRPNTGRRSMRVLCGNFLGFEVDSSRSYAKEMTFNLEAVGGARSVRPGQLRERRKLCVMQAALWEETYYLHCV